MRRHLLAAAVCGLALATAGCGGSHGPDHGQPAPTVPELMPAWTSTAVAEGDAAWTVGDTVVVASADGLGAGRFAGLDAATGRTRWTLKVPSVCTIADEPSPDGMLGIVLRSPGRHGICSLAGAIDLRTGRLTWRRDLASYLSDGYGHHTALTAVATGRRVLLATNDTLGYAVRVDLATGRVLSHLKAAEVSEADGDQLLVAEPAGSLARVRVTRYDVDSGHRTGSYLSDHTGRPGSVPGTDTLTTSETTESQAQLLRVADGRATPVGRGVGSSVVAAGGALVTALDGERFTYDARTGTVLQTAAVDGSEEPIGVVHGRVVDEDPEPLWLQGGKPSEALIVTDPTRPGAADQVLGTFPATGTATIAGGHLIAMGGRGLAAYDVPATGVDRAQLVGSVPWASGDLRPDQVLDLCPASDRTSLAALHLGTPADATGNCSWISPVVDNLRLTVTVFAPTGSESAAAAAAEDLEYQGGKAVSGIGDGARESDDSRIELSVRWHNVRLDLVDTYDDWDIKAPRARAGVRRIARDLVAELERRAAGR